MGLVADVFDALLINGNGDVLATTTLQDANIDVSVTTNEVRGGKGNSRLYTLHAGRDISVTLTDPEFRLDFLAQQLGTDIKTGAGIAYAMPSHKKGAAGEGGAVTFELEETPIADTVAVYDKDNNRVDVTVSGKTVTVAGGEAGADYEVRTYQYMTATNTKTFEINAKKFAKGVKLVLETFEINDEEEPVAKLQYIFERAIPTGNFTISTSSERTGTTNEMTLDIVKPKTSDLIGEMKYIPIVETP